MPRWAAARWRSLWKRTVWLLLLGLIKTAYRTAHTRRLMHIGFYTVARTHKKTHTFSEDPIKVLARKNVLARLVQGTTMSPKWGLTTHKLSNVRVVACAVEHTHTHTLQEQCSLWRTCLKLTETCIPRTLKTAVQPDSPRTRKHSIILHYWYDDDTLGNNL